MLKNVTAYAAYMTISAYVMLKIPLYVEKYAICGF